MDDESRVPQNVARFILYFSSGVMQVREQFVIFDAVAMVSAIGGTLGLCIGFSFSDLASFLFKMIEACIQRSKVDESTNDIMSGPITNEDIMNSLLKLKERQEKFETETKAMFKESKCCKLNKIQIKQT